MKSIKYFLLIAVVFGAQAIARQIIGRTTSGSINPPPPVLQIGVEVSSPSGPDTLRVGQQGSVKITVRNVGGDSAVGVLATLTCATPVPGLSYPPTVEFGTIVAGSSKTLLATVDAQRSLRGQRVVLSIQAATTSGIKTEPQSISIFVKEQLLVPVLSATAQFTEPSGNGALDAGESGVIKVVVRNTGDAAARNVIVRASLPPGILGLTLKNSAQFGDIAPTASSVASFNISASSSVRSQKVSIRFDGVEQGGISIDPISVLVTVNELVVAKDETPPVIELTDPGRISVRGMKVMAQSEAITTTQWSLKMKGTVKDSGGVAVVWVNDLEARLTPINDGVAFEADPMLSLGDNIIQIRAIDKSSNESKLTLHVKREASFVAGKYYALIIAVQDYADKSINPLEHPLADAQSVMSVLTERYTFDPKNMTYLKNPDQRTIIQAFQKLRGVVTEVDNLFIFYAGHGVWDEGLRQGYWLPTNATAGDPSVWIPNSTIRDYIRGIKTKHTLLVADACFSGGIFRTREAFAQPDMSIQKVYEMSSRRAITSGAMKAVPDKSVFVEYFVKRLRENTEIYLYTEKLYVSMKDAVINNSPGNQTPLYGVINEAGDEGGDFVFVRR